MGVQYVLYIFPSISSVDISDGTNSIVPSLRAWLDVIVMSLVTYLVGYLGAQLYDVELTTRECVRNKPSLITFF